MENKTSNPPIKPLAYSDITKTRLEDPTWDWTEQVHEMQYFPFSVLTLLVGKQEGKLDCKKAGCRYIGGGDLTQLCMSSSSCHHHLHSH